MSDSKAKGSSKKSLGTLTALLLTAAMMVGTGIFTTLGEATSKARSGILIAMLIGAVIALLTGISAAQAGVNYPEEGGAFIWMRIFGHPTISFAAGISYLMKGIFGLSIAALGLAYYSSQLFHGVPTPLIASGALLAVAAVNFFGIVPTAKVIIGIFFVNLVLLALYIGLSIRHVRVENLTPVLGTSGVRGLLSGAAAFFWAWDGFQRTAIMANEVKNPRKTIPIAIMGGIAIAAVVYTIVAGTTLGVVGPSAIASSDTPLLVGARAGIGSWGTWIIASSACILALSDILSDLLSTSKVGHAMGQERELPHWLGTIHKKFKSPQLVIILLTIVGLVLVNLVPLRRLVPVVSTFTLIWYAITHLSALNLNPEKRFAWSILSWIGMAACVALLVSLPLWSVAGAFGFLLLLLAIRWLVIRFSQKADVNGGGSWTVSGLTLAQGDIISVTAQYAGEKASKKSTVVVAAAPVQTAAPVISRTVTAADSTISGKAPSGASVVLSVNGVAHTAVVATGGNWMVSGLALTPGDSITVTAQSVGETMSRATSAIVAPAPLQTAEPVIKGRVTAADKTVSGIAPAGERVVLSVNGKAQPAVVADDGHWKVTGLTLSQGDSISVKAEHADETVNTLATTTVTPAPLQTAEPVISEKVTAKNTTISGKAPIGARVVLKINGVTKAEVIACDAQTMGLGATTVVATVPRQTAAPVISGIITAADRTVSGTAPVGASVVLGMRGVTHAAVVDAEGNWIVGGLTLAPGDALFVSAQCPGETVSPAATVVVQPMYIQSVPENVQSTDPLHH